MAKFTFKPKRARPLQPGRPARRVKAADVDITFAASGQPATQATLRAESKQTRLKAAGKKIDLGKNGQERGRGHQ